MLSHLGVFAVWLLGGMVIGSIFGLLERAWIPWLRETAAPAFWEWFVAGFLARRFPSRWRVIPRREDGRPMLRQFRVCSWLYLQSFLCGEDQEWFHIHRWRKMRSLVLSGSFTEERYPGAMWIRHRAWSSYAMDDTCIHRINSVRERTWTAFVMSGRNRFAPDEWGYFPRRDPGYLPWNRAIPSEYQLVQWSK